ncbi:unnamed protein product [Adineta ricciae]|uniref:G-protein coupled receptors family 1 profile domain-containing protein n=1 Tax=Adineta ricciae TaxID=249248 RepID=A0A814WW08_ADIRI|nr:unnamed protein product [Adineta ricciae]CAF1339009.1 unnamed protein product [Adineta ricciae]
MMFTNSLNSEVWYIPTDILRITCDSTTIGISFCLLIIIVTNKACRTVPMMLTANTCFTEFICACVLLSMTVFVLQNDIKQIIYEDSLCRVRGYLLISITVAQNYSYVLQAIYRYVTIVHPSRLFWQSSRFQTCLICLVWIFSFTIILPVLLTNQIVYNSSNQICHPPLGRSFGIIYITVILYLIPNIFLNIVYSRLVRFVREMSKRVTSTNVIARAERDLKMVKSIITITTILGILGLPFAFLIFWSLFTTPPRDHFRIAFIGVDMSTTAVIIAVCKTTPPIKTALSEKLAALQTIFTTANA